MKKALFVSTLLFSLIIIASVVSADADSLPRSIEALVDYPGGDKVGHFILFGILSFLLNASVLVLFPKRQPFRIILTVSLLLSILIGLEEWGQFSLPLSFYVVVAGRKVLPC